MDILGGYFALNTLINAVFKCLILTDNIDGLLNFIFIATAFDISWRVK